MKSPENIQRAIERLHLTTSAVLDEHILTDASAMLVRTAEAPTSRAGRSFWTALRAGRLIRVAAVVAVAAAAVGLAVMLAHRAGRSARTTVQETPPLHVPNAPDSRQDAERLLATQRATIEALHAAGDVDGLVRMLDEAALENQIRVARYLGEMGDARAIPALSHLALQWQGDSAENPFAQAIEAIETDVQPDEPNTPEVRQPLRESAVPDSRPLAVLKGALTDAETGEPIAGARVRISPVGGGRVHEATSDSHGSYSIESMGTDGMYNIRLAAPDHITPEEWRRPQETIQLNKNKCLVKDYALQRGNKVVIAVIDEKGHPIEKVRFYAAYVSDDMGRGPKQPARSDSEGIASLGGLQPDEYFITAAHPDYALAGQKVDLTEPGAVVSVAFELQQGLAVAGIATCSDGLPAGGWDIQTTPQWWHSVHCAYDYRVAEDGSFVLQHVLPGKYALGIMIPEDGGAHGICTIDVNLPPEGDFLDLQIPRPSPHGRVSITGTIRFVGQDYDQGFWLHAHSDAGHFGSTYLDRGEREFVLADLVPGLYDIDITILGERNEFRNIKAPSDGVVLEARIGKKLRLGGRVVDRQTGRPVTEFELRVAGDRQYRHVSDPNGAFEIDSYGPECRAHIKAEGYAEKISDNLYRDANEPVVIELAAPAAVTGIVVDEAGRRVEGATVSYRYRRRRDELPDGKYITSTDADGRFTVDDVPADSTYHWLVFKHGGYARVMRRLQVDEDGVTEVSVTLREGGAVEGRLYDWQGKPLPDTPVYFMDENHFPYWKENRARLGSVTTDGEGFYRLEHVPTELCYAFRADPDNQLGVVLAAIVPRAGRTVRLDIGGPWKATGRVLKDDEPMSNTQLMVVYEAGIAQGFKAYTLTDSSGRFAFFGMPTGRRRLYWAIPGGRSWDRWIELARVNFEQGVDLDLGDFEVTVAEVTVALVGADPAVPLEGWHTVLQEYHETEFWGRRVGQLQPRSDHLDPFTFAGVPAGVYEAVASRKDYPSIRELFEVEPGQKSHNMVMTIPSGSAAVSGTLTSTQREQQPALMLRSEDQRITAQVQPGADGSFAFSHLPPGDYIIGRASVAMSRTSRLAPVRLGPEEHKTIDISVDPDDAGLSGDGGLVVLVVTPDGLPLATPDVWLERDGQVIEPHFNTDDGKSFTGEPGGTYTLRAEYPGYRSARMTVRMKSKRDWTMQEALQPLVITMANR